MHLFGNAVVVDGTPQEIGWITPDQGGLEWVIGSIVVRVSFCRASMLRSPQKKIIVRPSPTPSLKSPPRA